MLKGLYVYQKSRYAKLLSWDIAKILQTCLGNSGIPGQTHQKQKKYQLAENFVFSSCWKWNLPLISFWSYFRHPWTRSSNITVSTCRKRCCLFASISTSPFTFLDILQKFSKLTILGTLAMTGLAHQNWWHQLVEKFMFICIKKQSTLHRPCFLEILIWGL